MERLFLEISLNGLVEDNCNFKKREKAKSKRRAERKLLKRTHGQATKSARGMPWHWEPKKDATNCEKPRGAVSRF